ncbi:MAG: murein biosynthesis integral membrane protein MurJ [Solirubrobacterales bacterium]
MSEGKQVAKAAGLLMVATLLARILGYVRDMVLAAWFGQSFQTDAYNAAFSVPDFIYALLVGGALSSAFIPVFSGYLARKQEEEAWEVASIVLNLTLVAMIVLVGLCLIFTKPVVMLLVPNLKPEGIVLAVTLTRVMFIQTFFMALNGIALGILNARKSFLTPALGSILYNIGIIVLGVALAKQFGIMAFSFGVVFGSILNFLIQIPALRRAGLRYTPSFNWRHPGVKQIFTLMVPVIAGLSVIQFNLFVNQNIASGLAEGSITVLRQAQRIMLLPVSLFGVSVSMALFPTLTERAANQELPGFKRAMSVGLRAILLITIPASMGLMALREPIIGLLFEQGAFTPQMTHITAMALFYYSTSLWAYSACQLLNRSFYAMQDSKTPVAIAIVSIGLNIVLSITLAKTSLGANGLALSYSIAGMISMVLLLGMLRYRLGPMDGGRIVRSTAVAAGASLIMYLVCALFIDMTGQYLHVAVKLLDMIQVVGGMTLGSAVFFGIILGFRLEETALLWKMVETRFPGLRFRI